MAIPAYEETTSSTGIPKIIRFSLPEYYLQSNRKSEFSAREFVAATEFKIDADLL
jgi:hypothetical protein